LGSSILIFSSFNKLRSRVLIGAKQKLQKGSRELSDVRQ